MVAPGTQPQGAHGAVDVHGLERSHRFGGIRGPELEERMRGAARLEDQGLDLPVGPEDAMKSGVRGVRGLDLDGAGAGRAAPRLCLGPAGTCNAVFASDPCDEGAVKGKGDRR